MVVGILIVWLFVSGTCFLEYSSARVCVKTDFKYSYTECNNNTRWRVQVPQSPGACEGKSVEAPIRAKPCDFTCNPGQHLDIDSNECKPCPVGTFSIGTGYRWDDWSKLPKGFDVSSRVIADDIQVNCSSSSWHAEGELISAKIMNSNCEASLTLTVTVGSAGRVQFSYFTRGQDPLATFDSDSGQCASNDRESGNIAILSAATYKAKVFSTKLKPGLNILRWGLLPSVSSSSSSSSDSRQADQHSVHIRSIEVYGLTSQYSCQRCRPGESSAAGSDRCTVCGRNQFSPDGSACKQCQPNQWAKPGSSVCQLMLPCTQRDYQAQYTPCTNGQHKLTYSWMQPKICNSAAGKDSVTLPADTQPTACGPVCSAGQQQKQQQLACEPCPFGQYSASPGQRCSQCPPNQQAVPGMAITTWLALSPMTRISCMPLADIADDAATAAAAAAAGSVAAAGCGSVGKEGWLLMGDRIQTVDMHSFTMRRISIHLPAFVRTESEVSEFSFEFQMDCIDNCSLDLFREFEDGNRIDLIKSWRGSQRRHKFRYFIHTSDEHNFTLSFLPRDWTNISSVAHRGLGNQLQIFSINATDVPNVGALRCRICPMGIQDQRCTQCPQGKYYNQQSSQCTRCPNGTVVAKQPAIGIHSCKHCPPGLRATPTADDCEFNPELSRPDGKVFNLSAAVANGNNWIVAGSSLFSWGGTKYKHVYNVSLNGDAVCASNASRHTHSTKSFICRVTVAPASSLNDDSSSKKQQQQQQQQSVTMLVMDLGSRIVNVTADGGNSSSSSSSSSSSNSRLQQLLAVEGWAADSSSSSNYDMHAFFTTDAKTPACPAGRQSVLTLRCSVRHSVPQLQLPPKCPDATCDGCLFHFVLLSSQFCPVCRLEDFEQVVGECVMGKQVVHLYPPQHCYLTGSQTQKQTKIISCPLVNKSIAIALLLSFAIGIVSLLLACHCYCKNRRLQYKYTQLAEAKEGNDELPGAESCAVNEGDDEDDDDHMGAGGRGSFSTGSWLSRMGRRLLPSGRRSGRTKRLDVVEHLNLTDSLDDVSI